MRAGLTLRATPPDPYPFTVAAVAKALEDAGVVHGIDDAAIGQTIARREYISDLTVAKGTPATEGENARIELLFDPAPDPYRPQPDGRVDWRETELVQHAVQGQPLARKIPPRPGIPGKTVTGKPVNPYTVRDTVLREARGTVLKADDPNVLVAAYDGAVRLSGEDILVDDVLRIARSVDFSIGNIDFRGSVVIGENVAPGFRVRATGDVQVRGCVEAASIESGGSVWVSQGIFGQVDARGGRVATAGVKAAKNVTVKYARNAIIEAGGDINVDLEAIACSMQSGGMICVGPPEGRRGRISGGQASAAAGIRAVDLGAESAVSTTLTIVMKSLPALQQEMDEAAKEIRRLQDKHKEVMGHVADFIFRRTADPARWTPAHEAVLEKLTQTANQIEKAAQEIEEQMAEKMPVELPRIIAYGTIYPGVRVTMGSTTRLVNENLMHSQLVLTDDRSRIVTIDAGAR